MNQIQFILMFITCVSALIFILFWKDFLSFLRPNWFYRLLIKTKAHDLEEHLIFKKIKKQDSYTINQNTYFINESFYILNGIKTWIYYKDISEPIELGKESGISAETLSKFQKSKIDGLWYEEGDLTDWIKQNIFLLILVGLILIIFIYIVNKDAATQKLILNITSR